MKDVLKTCLWRELAGKSFELEYFENKMFEIIKLWSLKTKLSSFDGPTNVLVPCQHDDFLTILLHMDCLVAQQ